MSQTAFDHVGTGSPDHPEGTLILGERSLAVVLDGLVRRFHYVWLRDNSWAAADRVFPSGERRLFTAHIPPGIAPTAAFFDPVDGTGRVLERRAGLDLQLGLVTALRLLRQSPGGSSTGG